jgi:hypothetical protein
MSEYYVLRMFLRETMLHFSSLPSRQLYTKGLYIQYFPFLSAYKYSTNMTISFSLSLSLLSFSIS